MSEIGEVADVECSAVAFFVVGCVEDAEFWGDDLCDSGESLTIIICFEMEDFELGEGNQARGYGADEVVRGEVDPVDVFGRTVAGECDGEVVVVFLVFSAVEKSFAVFEIVCSVVLAVFAFSGADVEIRKSSVIFESVFAVGLGVEMGQSDALRVGDVDVAGINCASIEGCDFWLEANVVDSHRVVVASDAVVFSVFYCEFLFSGGDRETHFESLSLGSGYVECRISV